jgi:dTDP-4-amino-4,6-dideoxygalactose transaminase
MKLNRIFLSTPHMGGGEQKYIQEAFDTNWVSSVGANIDAFEANLESYLGSRYVAVLNSGTSAIHLGLILLGVKKDDIVICQSMTFAASANPILYQGATPVFVDSEIETWNICPIALEEAILDSIKNGKKPKAIIAVHLYGVPFKVDEISAIAKHYEIPILEDAAEALGSRYKEQSCGLLGDVGVFSFNGSKIITTSSGGAIITKTKKLKQKAVFLATQSKENTAHYEHRELGYNYRMSNICAGIGRGQMEVLDQHLVLRRSMHDFYVHLFQDIKGVTVFTVPNDDFFSNYWLNTIVIDPEITSGISNEKLSIALDEAVIESRPLWKPMHLQPLFKNYPYYGGSVAEDLYKKGLCLPSGSNLSDEDKDRIKVVIHNLFTFS